MRHTGVQPPDLRVPVRNTGWLAPDLGVPVRRIGWPTSDLGVPVRNTGWPTAKLGVPVRRIGVRMPAVRGQNAGIGLGMHGVGTPSFPEGVNVLTLRHPVPADGHSVGLNLDVVW